MISLAEFSSPSYACLTQTINKCDKKLSCLVVTAKLQPQTATDYITFRVYIFTGNTD